MVCTFPVCPQSDPGCIMDAFMQSGYWSMLTPQQQQAAQQDPNGWLQGHPWLYSAFPGYFTPNCSVENAPTSTASQTIPQIPVAPGSYSTVGDIYEPLNENAQNVGKQQSKGAAGQPWWAPLGAFANAMAGFGEWINEFFGKTIPSLETGTAQALGTVVTAFGEHPTGAILLIVFIVIFFIVLFFLR